MDEGSLSDADLLICGAEQGDETGYSVDGAGDVDGDGLDDLLLGAYRWSEPPERPGAAWLLWGREAW